MFTKASNKIAEKLIFMQIVSNEDKEIYAYGINRVLTIVLNVAATLILGIIYGRVYEAALFFTAFILLRSYSGGYHASTPMKCYVFTVLLITTILSVMKFVSVHKYVCFGLSLLSDIIIILLSPNEAKNKPLDAIERIIYKRKTVIILCIESIIIFISFRLSNIETYSSLMLVHITIALSLTISSIKMHNFDRTLH